MKAAIKLHPSIAGGTLTVDSSGNLVTDWIPCTTPPVRDGVYELRLTQLAPEAGEIRGELKRGKFYFDDAKSPCPMDGVNTCPGDWQWRGTRRWVLVRKADPLLTALNQGEPVDAYLADARPRSAKFSGLAGARPFRDQADAERFAARYSRLGLTAVLP